MSDEPQEPSPDEDAERTIAVPPPSDEKPLRELETVLDADRVSLQAPELSGALNRDAVDAAVRKGLITRLQGSTFLERSGSESDVISVLVDQGLIQPEAAEQLREEVADDFVPGYRLVGELGRGGMGVVYRAVHRSLNRQVALKVITPELRLSREHADRFKREAQTLAALNHPNIVQIYDTGEVGEKLYISLELVDGEDLGEYVDRKKRLDPLEATKVVLDAARGLGHAFASESKVIHRDVKPGNLLRTTVAGSSEPVTKVTDLGLARMRGDQVTGRKTKAGTIMGSPSYMAPEQAAGDPVDHRADIYSLGATYYHFLAGQPPFVGPLVKVLSKRLSGEQVPSPGDLVEGISAPVLRVIDRMLAQEAEHRYQAYDDLIADLEAVLAGEPPRCPVVPRDASSLSFAAGAPPELPQPGAPEVAEVAAAESKSGGVVIGVLLVLGLVVGGLYLSREEPQVAGDDPPDVVAPVDTTIEVQLVDPYAKTRAGVEGLLAVLENAEPAARLKLLESAKAAQVEIARLPDDEQPALNARLRLACAAVVEPALSEGEALYANADYVALNARCDTVRAFADVGGFEPSARLETLHGFAAAGCRLGAEERAKLEQLEQAAAGAKHREVLALTAGFPESYPFSPDLERVAELRQIAEAALLSVQLRCGVAGAKLYVENKQRALPFSEHFERGSVLVCTVRAPGHLPLRRVLTVEQALDLELRLSPEPTRQLRGQGEGFPLFGGQGPKAKSLFALAKRGWTLQGWVPTTDVDPTSGTKTLPALEAKPGSSDSVAAEVELKLAHSKMVEALQGKKVPEGWRLELELALPAGVLELRLLGGADKTRVALRVRGARLEIGARRPGLDDLDVSAACDLLATPFKLDLAWDGERVVVFARCEGMDALAPVLSYAPDWTPLPPDTSRVEFVASELGDQPALLKAPALVLLFE